MRRLVRIVTRLNLGGPARQIEGLTPHLAAAGWETLVLHGTLGPSEGSLEEAVAAAGARLVRIPGLSREPRLTRERGVRRALEKHLREFAPDLVHTHLAKAGWHGRAAARRLGIPAVHTFHGHLLHGYFGPLGTRLYRFLERRATRAGGGAICVSERVRTELEAAGILPVGAARVIRPGIEVERFAASPERVLARSAPPRLLFVGRLVEIKRPLAFVALVAALRARGRDVHGTILGTGPLAGAVTRAIATAGLAPYLEGPRAVADLAPEYARSDLLVLCSENEGLPLCVLEAMASALPVVATAVGGVDEAVREGLEGVLVARGDDAALLRAVEGVLDDPERARGFARSALARASEHFDLRRSASEHLALYAEQLGAHS